MMKSSLGFSKAFEMATEDTSLFVEIGKSGGSEDITFDEMISIHCNFILNGTSISEVRIGWIKLTE